MLLKCDSVVEGQGPSESIATIPTISGAEEVIVYSGLVVNNRLNVGPILGKDGDKRLVELPRESASGRWRVWVPEGALAEI